MLNIKKVQVPYPNESTRRHVENLSFFSGEGFKLNFFVAIVSLADSKTLERNLMFCNLTKQEFEDLKLLCLE